MAIHNSPPHVLEQFSEVHKLLLKILRGKEYFWCLDLSVYFSVKITLFLLAVETWTLLLNLGCLSEATVPKEQMFPFLPLGRWYLEGVGRPGLPFGRLLMSLPSCKSVTPRTASGIFISYSGFPLTWLPEVWGCYVFLTL